LKLPTQLNLSNGELKVYLEAGRVHDQKTPIQRENLPAGALRLADLGFFDLSVLDDLAQAGVWWLVRYKIGTALLSPSGDPLDVVASLQASTDRLLDVPLQVGAHDRLTARLVAERLPAQAAAQRRRKLRESVRKRGKPLSAR